MGNTNIEWCDKVWNPVRGCSKVSAGCANCYAERVAQRFSGPGLPYEGLATAKGWTGKVRLVEDALTAPLGWRKPQRIFVNSMSDLFHEALSDDAIDEVFSVMALAGYHTFQVLTKRPQRMRDYALRVAASKPHDAVNSAVFDAVNAVHGGFASWPLPNVWLGVSVEDQATADARIPVLLDTPAAVRFVSYEPALGPVEFQRDRGWLAPFRETSPSLDRSPRIDWLIAGGESGPNARSCNVAWLRGPAKDCLEAGVAVFMKQLGARPWAYIDSHESELRHIFWLRNRKGGDPAEWPEDLRLRQFPEVRR